MSGHPFTLHRGWIEGALGWIVSEQGRYYATHWQLGAPFEAKVAQAIGEWMLRYDPTRDLMLLALDDEGILGAVCLDGSGPHVAAQGARIRFFIVADRARGTGVGRALMQHMMDFVRETGFDRVFLTTFRGLDAARRLYETSGFELASEILDSSWGVPLYEQRFEWRALPHEPATVR